MAAILAAIYPELFAAAGVHSGLPYGAGGDLPSRAWRLKSRRRRRRGGGHKRERVRTIVFHGDERRGRSHPSNGEAHPRRRTRRPRRSAARHRFSTGSAGGRTYTRILVMDGRGVATPNIGPSRGSATPGPAAVRRGRSPTPTDPTPRARCFGFSWRGRRSSAPIGGIGRRHLARTLR